MLKKFSTKELIFIALLGAIVFTFDFLFVTSLEAIVGIPGIGLLVDTIFIVALASIGGLMVRKFGVFTIWATVYGALVIPTNIIGPPGFYKIILGFALGLLADIIILLFNYRKTGYYFALPLANTLVIPLLLWVLFFLGLPGAEQLANSLFVLIIVSLVEGIIGAWIGIKIYDKIKNKGIVRQISENV